MADQRRNGECDHGYPTTPIKVKGLGKAGWVQEFALDCETCDGAPATLEYYPGKPPSRAAAHILFDMLKLVSYLQVKLGEAPPRGCQSCCDCPCHKAPPCEP